MDWTILWWIAVAAVVAYGVRDALKFFLARRRLRLLLTWAGFSPGDRALLIDSKFLPNERIIEGIKARAERLINEANFLNEACKNKLSVALFSDCRPVFERFIADHLEAGEMDTTLSRQRLAELRAFASACAVLASEKKDRRLEYRLMRWQFDTFQWESISCRFLHSIST